MSIESIKTVVLVLFLKVKINRHNSSELAMRIDTEGEFTVDEMLKIKNFAKSDHYLTRGAAWAVQNFYRHFKKEFFMGEDGWRPKVTTIATWETSHHLFIDAPIAVTVSPLPVDMSFAAQAAAMEMVKSCGRMPNEKNTTVGDRKNE